MLTHLSIKNYALIENVEIDFSNGLSIITGETGAGKSILLGALGLISGNRADYEVISKDASKCVVEAVFEINALKVQSFFDKHQLDYSPQTIIRREIKLGGISRAFINDTPVNLQQLKELANYLIDIHSQHQNLLLSDNAFQLNVLDAFSGLSAEVDSFRIDYKEYARLQRLLKEALQKEALAREQQDFIQFQFNELEAASVREGEFLSIEEELKMLENAEEIKLVLNRCNIVLTEGDQTILEQLKSVKQQLVSVLKFSNDLSIQLNRYDGLLIELNDICSELKVIEEKTSHDPERISTLNQRVDLLNHFFQKHRVNSDKELLFIQNTLEAQLNEFSSLDSEINALKDAVESVKIDLLKKAAFISLKRNKRKASLEENLISLLKNLGMPDAQIKIEIKELNELTERGADRVNFLFSANKGGGFNEISKVASGGEISRMMLCIKSVLSKVKILPTIIFDEVDTGVSGEIAFKLGSVMEELGKDMQVIAITHLPQIASRGNMHYEVYKSNDLDKTISHIRVLGKEERIKEIAKMLSGDTLSDAALKNAKTLLKSK